MNFLSNAVTHLSQDKEDITMSESAPVSLEDRLLRAYANESTWASAEQRDVLASLNSSEVIANPEELFRLQQRTADYNLHVSLISTLVRKGVGAVETLLRS
ncbi:type III secretion system inner rod subunit SctI [Yersinia kristensenii]|uniref:type III secretion system inner rod subunit SctI n=1 Tax=Yersinia kristensenii TaxID=28152 RepID=UPI0005E7449E|nr:type III secretion system inner rod subunit SctI [Yersinia kristensenii]CNF34380.1 putative virulence associated protein [Yersinia kristensenii]